MSEAHAQWGTVKYAELSAVEDGELDEVMWILLVDPNADGEIHHGSEGSTLPDTVVLTFDKEPVALCDPAMLQILNYLVWDSEYYFALRLREILDETGWAKTVLSAYAPPALVYAEDKFHGIDYQRGLFPEDETMSFGGNWEDLEAEVAERVPLPEGMSPPVTVMALQHAVEGGDLERVRQLLEAGVDPRGSQRDPEDLPALQHRHVRDTNPLWAAATSNVDPAILVCLLGTGIAPDARPSEAHMTLLHGAVANGREAQVRVLLQRGADPRAKFNGKNAFELARDEAIATLLREVGAK